MVLFLIGIAILIGGYFTYGRFIEKIVGPDDRETPAVHNPDGVDFVVLPHWKNMLIQLLNIAGVGPVVGVILGIKFGAIVFLILPIGNLIAGATHDFLGGMMSLRDNGANLPKLIRDNLGAVYAKIFSWFMILLLILVVAVFINIPAGLADGLIIPNEKQFWLLAVIVFAYYVIATLFPVDKIIGKVYPIFGFLFLIGTFAVFAALMVAVIKDPSLLQESEAFRENMFTEKHAPIIPLLFVTIACGIISGFHATQSPIVSRTMKTERQARSTFYGMMVMEGIIGMVWAGAGLAIYNKFPELMAGNPTNALIKITTEFLGYWMGLVTVIAVVILAITSGDTALRSTRLSLAEMLHIDQKPIKNRLLLCLPLIVAISFFLWWSNVSAASFNYVWNYFSWGNQVLAASTLMSAAVWLFRQKKNGFVALIPGMFMTFIIATYILWTSTAHKQAYGLGLPVNVARVIGILVACLFAFYVWRRVKAANGESQIIKGE